MSHFSLAVLTLAASLASPSSAPPARAADRVDYLKDVKPLLAARCFACHGALQQKGDLRADTAASLRQGGGAGPAVVPGRAADSPLIARVTAAAGARRMPPASEGEPLSAAEVARLRAWIDQGADAPAHEKPEPDPKDHWAFRPPVRPAVPRIDVPQAAVLNPIDTFLEEEWRKAGLKPQPEADRRVLLRRLHLDLVGLPPTREELNAFAADPAPDAYERAVDRLLASPRHGERWARHWMDVWRYSDWWGLGAEVRNSQKHLWHWRDWILESLNAGTPYPDMVRDMLAADELAPDDPDRLRATGFLARQYFKFNRNSWLDETVEHTAKAFLGLTLNCARCHDHKYDPVAQADYYRFRAFFEPYQLRTDLLPGEPDPEKDGLPRAFDCNLDAPTYRFVRGDEKQPVTTRPLAPGLPALLSPGELKIEPVSLPPAAHSPGLRPHVLADLLRQAEARIAAARAARDQARKEFEAAARAPAAPSTALAAKPSASAPPLARDDFARPRPKLWDTVAGAWKYEGGRLRQTDGGDLRAVLRSRLSPPADFEATFRFVITGGDPYRSVGLTFDAAADAEVLVYASAQSQGPKVQIAYRQAGGQHVYPPEAALARPVKIGEPFALTVRVMGPLVNVAVNGEHALAYRLPVPRRPGRLELITYTATADFLAFELSPLPASRTLVEAPGAAPAPRTVDQARAALAVAEKALLAAEAQAPALKARADADRARFASSPAADARDLAHAAARAEKQAALAAAEEALARADLAVLDARAAAPDRKTAAENARAAALTNAESARAALASPGETYSSLRGAVKSPESNLETEASRAKPFPVTSTGRRTALARWMTDPRHPLTARVAVNHVWARHFSKPLVATVFDYGRKGAAPTHPALLDWLACEFRDSGGSFKHLHRLVVTSAAYRRSSSAAGCDPATRAADPDNRLLWRHNPVRMESEVVRDSLLALAGDLDGRMGGPPVPAADETSRRRGLYFVHSHNEHNKFLTLFDDASVLECYRRAESIVPQQALALANSRFAMSAAARLAARLHAAVADPSEAADAAFAALAFETVLGTRPTPAEQGECLAALAGLRRAAAGRPDAALRARANLVQALVNHNDFVTVR